jgi:hypothetical protein
VLAPVQNAFSKFPISKIWFQEKFRGGANHFESNDIPSGKPLANLSTLSIRKSNVF